jgi:plasmid stability protein
MAQLTVRNLEQSVKTRLQRRAKRHGHSMEEEVRDILRNAVKGKDAEDEVGLGTRIQRRFAGIGFRDGEFPEIRGQLARPAIFEK